MSFEWEQLDISQRGLWWQGVFGISVGEGVGAKRSIENFVNAVEKFTKSPTAENENLVYIASGVYMNYASIDDESLNYLSPEFIRDYGEPEYTNGDSEERNIYNAIYNSAAGLFLRARQNPEFVNAGDADAVFFDKLKKNIEWASYLAQFIPKYEKTKKMLPELAYEIFNGNELSAKIFLEGVEKMDFGGNTFNELLEQYYKLSRDKNLPISITTNPVTVQTVVAAVTEPENIKKFLVPAALLVGAFLAFR